MSFQRPRFISSPKEPVVTRDEVAEFVTGFGRSLTINPVMPTREPNAAVAKALADDVKALGNTLHRVIRRWHAKTGKQAAE